jgi:hypothetical protein
VPNLTDHQKQTLFTMSMMAGLGACNPGTVPVIEAKLLANIDRVLAQMPLMGHWEVVWGPAAYRLPHSEYPDNAMFVAQYRGLDAGMPKLVVAIAGTNGSSPLDFLVEDVLVSTQVDWPSQGHGTTPSGSPKISLSTRIGLSVLQGLQPSTGLPGAGLTLQAFLASQAGAPVTVSINGHSLGGALAPTLALWLHETQAGWDPAGHVSLSAFATAGPTAGNHDFAAYLDSQIGANLTRIYNRLDLVPRAWVQADMAAIPDLYLPTLQPTDELNKLVSFLLAISGQGHYTQIAPNAAPLAHAMVLPLDIPQLDTPLKKFLAQGILQHIDNYFILLGILDRIQYFRCIKDAAIESVRSSTRLLEQMAKFRAAA